MSGEDPTMMERAGDAANWAADAPARVGHEGSRLLEMGSDAASGLGQVFGPVASGIGTLFTSEGSNPYMQAMVALVAACVVAKWSPFGGVGGDGKLGGLTRFALNGSAVVAVGLAAAVGVGMFRDDPEFRQNRADPQEVSATVDQPLNESVQPSSGGLNFSAP